MKNNFLLKKWIKENGTLIKKIYGLAKEQEIDLTSEAEIMKLLRSVNTENSDLNHSKLLIQALQLFDLLAKKEMEKRERLAKLN